MMQTHGKDLAYQSSKSLITIIPIINKTMTAITVYSTTVGKLAVKNRKRSANAKPDQYLIASFLEAFRSSPKIEEYVDTILKNRSSKFPSSKSISIIWIREAGSS